MVPQNRGGRDAASPSGNLYIRVSAKPVSLPNDGGASGLHTSPECRINHAEGTLPGTEQTCSQAKSTRSARRRAAEETASNARVHTVHVHYRCHKACQCKKPTSKPAYSEVSQSPRALSPVAHILVQRVTPADIALVLRAHILRSPDSCSTPQSSRRWTAAQA